MHTKEQTLNRLAEFAAFAESLPEEKLDMGTWTPRNTEDKALPKDCGTAMCVLGWCATLKKFEFEFKIGETWPTMKGVRSSDPYRAATFNIFGFTEEDFDDDYNIYLTAYRIAHSIFAPIAQSDYDATDEIDALIVADGEWDGTSDDEKKVFALRVEFAKIQIEKLYEKI